MDTDPKQRRKMNPRFKANLLSILTFGWTLETFIMGYNRDIKEEDLYAPLPEHRSDVLGDALENEWKEEVHNSSRYTDKKPSLRKVLCKVFGAELMLYGLILAAMEFIIRLQQPLFLGLLLRYYSPTQELYNRTVTYSYLSRLYRYYDDTQNTIPIAWGEAVFFSFGVVFCSMVNVMVQHPFMMGAMHIGMKMRVGVCSLIYRKTLRVNLQAMSETRGGSVVNLLANDVNRFDTGPLLMHYLWIGPLETVIMTFYIYRELGMPAVYGVCMILIVMPFQTYLGFKTAHFRKKTANNSDDRVRLMEEIIMGIEVIKMYTWEQPFRKIIDAVRRKEIRYIKLTSYIRGIVMSFIMFTSRFSIFVTVLLYVMYVQRITVESVFFLTCFYNIIKQTMTLYFPQAVGQVAELEVAIQRIRDFLLSEECLLPYRKDSTVHEIKSERKKKKRVTISDDLQIVSKNAAKASSSKHKPTEVKGIDHDDIAIKFDNASSRWLKSSPKDDVVDITFDIYRKSLTTVIGTVGSGKSTLLHMMLSELPCVNGNMEVSGTLSYASQDPWLFVGSVRQNILFGKPFDKTRYMEVCKVCALERDISMFPHGDKTIIGERGISLSGGQRARINLARAVYKDADIYLLDDPLSAVDTQVARHLFENCIKKYLKDKTVVLVTHQLQFIKSVDQIIIINNGTVLAQGKFEDLKGKELAIIQTMQHQSQEVRTDDKIASSLSKITLAPAVSVWSRWSIVFNMQDQKQSGESQTEGRVGGSVYKNYFLADSTCSYVLFVVTAFLLAQFFASACDYWLSRWSIAEDHLTGDATMDFFLWSQYGLSRNSFALIFGILTAATVIVALIRAAFFFTLCMKSSIKLHDNMFDCVSNAPMSFFHSNPSGRVLNRFSKDMGSVDEYLPQAMLDCVQIILNLVGVICVILVTEILFLVPIAATLMIFIAFRLVYIRASSAIKRLEGITKSPVFGHINATLLGLPTIRSFQAEVLLVKEFDRHQDLHSAAWYLFITTSRAFGYFLDVVCLLFIVCVTFSYIMKTDIEGSCAGLVITQSISLTGIFQWGMRQSAEMENQMTSVERVLEYTRIPRETSLHTKPQRDAPANWPSEGAIVFDNLSLRYSPGGNEVLHKLNLTIPPHAKIGIVGRTGAGKSSIIQALFRLAYLQGAIYIDGVDITAVHLHALRQKISIIPQEPVLFSGTIRKNLDPFDQYSDEILLSALEKVELLDEANPKDALYKRVSECGANFSVGERQLVCLARAIVNNDRVLLMDEATANVDAATDALVQAAIRTHFRACTVLTVAHRLNTVIDSDKILVLDGGHLVEYEHPHVLLQNRHGSFRRMVADTGPAMAQLLHSLAAQNYNKSKSQS